MKRLTLYLDDPLYEKLRDRAFTERVSMSGLAVKTVTRYLAPSVVGIIVTLLAEERMTEDEVIAALKKQFPRRAEKGLRSTVKRIADALRGGPQ